MLLFRDCLHTTAVRFCLRTTTLPLGVCGSINYSSLLDIFRHYFWKQYLGAPVLHFTVQIFCSSVLGTPGIRSISLQVQTEDAYHFTVRLIWPSFGKNPWPDFTIIPIYIATKRTFSVFGLHRSPSGVELMTQDSACITRAGYLIYGEQCSRYKTKPLLVIMRCAANNQKILHAAQNLRYHSSQWRS